MSSFPKKSRKSVTLSSTYTLQRRQSAGENNVTRWGTKKCTRIESDCKSTSAQLIVCVSAAGDLYSDLSLDAYRRTFLSRRWKASLEEVQKLFPYIAICWGSEALRNKPKPNKQMSPQQQLSELTIMYAFVFTNLMKRSRHQKQHLRQESTNRAHPFWESGGHVIKPSTSRLNYPANRVRFAFAESPPYLSVCDRGTLEQFGSLAPQRGSESRRPENPCGSCEARKQVVEQTFDFILSRFGFLP